MKNTLFTVSLLLFYINVTAQANQDVSPKADSLFYKLMAAANPVKRNWVYKTAVKYRGKEITELKAMSEASNASAVLGSMTEGDIEAMAFLVLMQASKTGNDDLKTIMAEMKTVNNAKVNQRKQIQSNASTKNNIILKARDENAVVKKDTLKRTSLNPNLRLQPSKKDDLNEMGEEQQLRMQMAMDRRSKMMEAISNLLKKIADTEDQIIQNIK